MQTKIIISFSISDIETKETINNVYKKYKYTLDPHTAVGYSALDRYISKNNRKFYRNYSCYRTSC